MVKLNDDKIEFIIIGTRKQRSKIDIPHININGSDIAPISTVHNLGVMFDSEIILKAHISLMNKSAYPQLKRVRVVKPLWTRRQHIQLPVDLLGNIKVTGHFRRQYLCCTMPCLST